MNETVGLFPVKAKRSKALPLFQAYPIAPPPTQRVRRRTARAAHHDMVVPASAASQEPVTLIFCFVFFVVVGS
jgi:hypothetical protein